MIRFSRRVITHFDFIIPAIIAPIVILSFYLMGENTPILAKKQIIYISIGIVSFLIAFIFPIRKLKWMIPYFYWISIAVLIILKVFGTVKNGAKSWITLPLIESFTIQPSEVIKPIFILMLAYQLEKNPPPIGGYRLLDFFKIGIYIIVPSFLVAQEPDLGGGIILAFVGFATLFLVGVNKKIIIGGLITLLIVIPLAFSGLKGYQKTRINLFISGDYGYQVKQSIIAIGSGGIKGKDKDEATQTLFNFLPISSSDFLFSSFAERFGFIGTSLIIFAYLFLILYIMSKAIKFKSNYFNVAMLAGVSFLVFSYMSVNIAMAVGFAPVTGLPLPFFSYGGSNFISFMILMGMVENTLVFRFDFTDNFIKI